MAQLEGGRYDQRYQTKAVQVAGDVTKGTFAKISDASTHPVTVTTCGAGEVMCGVFEETVDYSEDGGNTSVVIGGIVPMVAGAAISDATLPIKSDASGLPTPVTTDLDVIGGKPWHTASSGSTVDINLALMGSYYGV